MSKKTPLMEDDVRLMEFVLDRTLIRKTGETDIFVPVEDADRAIGLEIHVRLDRRGEGTPAEMLTFNSLGFDTSRSDQSFQLRDAEGRGLDSEMSEVLAWELIEYNEEFTGYHDDRRPRMLPNGKPAPHGSTVMAVRNRQHDVEMDMDI